MMKHLLFFLMACISGLSYGQSTFYSQSFESTSGYSFPNGNGVGASAEDFFNRTDSASAPLQEVFTYNGYDGNFFIAAEDIDGVLSSSIGQVYIDNININGRSNLSITVALASGTNIDIDEAADSIAVEVKIDNGPWMVVGRFRADSSTFTSTSGPFNGQFAEDTNNDGYGDGALLNGNFQDFTWNIIGSGDSLDVRITVNLNSGDEEAAFDNIRISEMPSSAYTLQILHASDLEGGVNAIDRARYFAAIVDTLEDTYANSITLSAGDNYIPGPFFNAAGDLNTFRAGGVFNNVYNRHYGVSSYDGLRETPGRADISIMNIIGFDASAAGNHEFDAGPDAMQAIIEEDFRSPAGPSGDRWVGAQFPYLSANLDFANSSTFGSLYASSVQENTSFETGPTQSTAGNSSIAKVAAATYITRGSEKIGVVGATTPLLATISSPGDVSLKGPSTNDLMLLAAEIQPWIDSLVNNHGINKIVLVTHLQQIQLEEQLAGMLNHVDVIIAGGSDAILAKTNHRLAGGSSAYKPYPILTSNGNGEPLAIVSTDGEYSYVGRLVIDFDNNGVLIPSSIDSLISGPYISDSAMVNQVWGSANAFADPNGKAALVDSITSAVKSVVISKDGNILGQSDVYLNGERASVRTEETNFGNLSADANLWQAKQYDNAVAVSIKNGGGIRASIGEVRETSPGVYQYLPPQANPLSGKLQKEVSQLDVENTLRFNNQLSVLDLSATDLKAVLEHGVAAWAVGATPGQFCQVGGVRFSFDPMQAAGSRIRSAVLIDTSNMAYDTLVKNGVVYGNANRNIKVVTLNFLAGGGDGYPFNTLGNNRIDLDTVSTLPAGNFTFANSGSEQDALAEYMQLRYSNTPFDMPDQAIDKDTRIENLSYRADDIFGLSVSFAGSRTSVTEGAGAVTITLNYNNESGSNIPVDLRLNLGTTASNDFTTSPLRDTAIANTNGTLSFTVNVIDDALLENDEFLVMELNLDSNRYFVPAGADAYHILFIRDNDNQGPTAANALNMQYIASYQGLASGNNSTEIAAYDPLSKRLFVTNANLDRFEILDMSDPRNMVKVDSISVAAFGAINSIAVHNGIVAAAIEGPSTMSNGVVAFYDTNGTLLSNVTVGVLPDMLTFSPNGNQVVVACEGEPSNDYTQDPEGSIAIIDVSGNIANLTNANVTLLNFNAYDSQMASLRASGVRLFGPNASVSQDMEPEYVTIDSISNTAYVACQENNAMVVVNLSNNTITSIIPLGTKDHSLPGNGMDTDRGSNNIHILTAPFKGFYMPDAIASYSVNGTPYILTANEGDSRDYSGYSEEARLDDITLDPDSFPNPEILVDVYGDIKITLANGNNDADADYEEVYTYGARSFSIWNGVTGALVYDSGDDFEHIVANHPVYHVFFNTNENGTSIKNRSDDKGPEPEAITLGTIGQSTYAFVGMERTGGVVVYDVTNPNSPVFEGIDIPRNVSTGGGDIAPEGLIFIPKTQSPTGTHLLLAANEVSSTITVWEINDTLTSVNELSSKSDITVYPNPANEMLYISSESSEFKQIQLLDLNGRRVRFIANPKQLEVLNVADLSKNVYFLIVETNEGIKTQKVVIQ